MSQLVTLLEIGLTNHIYFDSNGLTEHTNHLRASFSFEKKTKKKTKKRSPKKRWKMSLLDISEENSVRYDTCFKNYTLFHF